MTGERIGVLCEANGCQLKPVVGGVCLFHSRIELRYWPEVTRYLNSAEGMKVVAKSRRNRMLWALGTFNEVEYYHSRDEHGFNTREALKEVLTGLDKNGRLPEGVDYSDIEQAARDLTRQGLKTADPKINFGLYDICATYERMLVDYVAERAGRKD